jgi:ATPase subunit of ABC transporter with duplicated ATPase domains
MVSTHADLRRCNDASLLSFHIRTSTAPLGALEWFCAFFARWERRSGQMPCIIADSLAFAFVDREPIIDECSFRLSSGFTGLVGANGSGKTTLARLIAGALEPSSGKLRLEPAGARVLICEQGVEALSAEVQAFALDASGAAARWRGRLRLEAAELSSWLTLSPGERKRWQLGAALATEPEILILDEPTNHVDADARDSLRLALSSYRGVGLLISHDRELLDRVSSQTLRLHAGRATLYPGPYSRARELWLAEAARSRLERGQRVAERDRVAARLAATRVQAAAAERNRSTRERQRYAGDREARAIGAKNLAEWGEAALSRGVGKLRDELARKESQIPEFVVDKTLGSSVFADFSAARKRDLASLTDAELRVGERVLARHSGLLFRREDRVWLSGANGAGKTTLLKKMLVTADPAHVVYLPQELEQKEIAALAPAVAGLPHAQRGRLFSIVAALGVDPERLLVSAEWSPGEARKVKIALGFATHAWALILDEPTNHLDMPAIERLEAALGAYPGALLVVSHDARFAHAVCRTRWHLADETLSPSEIAKGRGVTDI